MEITGLGVRSWKQITKCAVAMSQDSDKRLIFNLQVQSFGMHITVAATVQSLFTH